MAASGVKTTLLPSQSVSRGAHPASGAGEMSFSQYLNSTMSSIEPGVKEEWGNQRIRILVHKLQLLECPYLEGMDGAVVNEVIFSPGEARLRVLTWLTGRLHQSLEAELTGSSTSYPIATIPKLALLLHEAGLCLKEDHELIKGTTQASKQLQFWEALVDMVTVASKGECSEEKLQSLPWQAERCCRFVDDLCRQEDLGVVFPSSVSLIPPGIGVPAERVGVVSTGRLVQSSRDTPPSLSVLSKRQEELQAQLEEKQLQLEVIMETHTYAELQPDVLASCHKMLSVSLGMLAQLSVSFCHTYEAEIQPWCNRKAPPLTPLGPLCQRVHNAKTEVDKLFKALEILEVTLKKLDQLKTSNKPWDRGDVCSSAHQTLKDCLSVLTSD